MLLPRNVLLVRDSASARPSSCPVKRTFRVKEPPLPSVRYSSPLYFHYVRVNSHRSATALVLTVLLILSVNTPACFAIRFHRPQHLQAPTPTGRERATALVRQVTQENVTTSDNAQSPAGSSDVIDTITTTQANGQALYRVLLILPAQPFESTPNIVTGAAVTVDDPDIVTDIAVSIIQTPQPLPDGIHLIDLLAAAPTNPSSGPASFADITLSLNGLPGSTTLRAALSTANGVALSTALAVSVRGIALPGPGSDGLRSASFRRGVRLGAFNAWLDARIVVLPFELNAAPAQADIRLFAQLAAQRPAQRGIAPLAEFGAGAQPVPTVRTGIPPGDAFEMCEVERDGAVTVAAQTPRGGSDDDDFDLEATRFAMPERCAGAVDLTAGLLALRLEPYMVGTFAFQMLLTVMVEGEFGGSTAVNFWFDTDPAPPPVFPATNMTLDAFGNEELRFGGVANALSALPGGRNFSGRDFGLFVVQGAELPPAISPPGRLSRSPTESNALAANLSLIVPRLSPSPTSLGRGRSEVPASPQVNFFYLTTERNGANPAALRQHSAKRGRSSTLEGRPAVRQDAENDMNSMALSAVVFAEPGLRLTFASPELAQRGACNGRFLDITGRVNTTAEPEPQFLQVAFRAPSFRVINLSAWKALSIGSSLVAALGDPFTSGDVRFVEFDNTTRTLLYEVIYPRRGRMPLLAARDAIERDIVDETLQERAMVRAQDLELVSVSLSSVSQVCEGAIVIGGARNGLTWKVALIVVGAVVLVSVCTFVVAGRFVQSGRAGEVTSEVTSDPEADSAAGTLATYRYKRAVHQPSAVRDELRIAARNVDEVDFQTRFAASAHKGGPVPFPYRERGGAVALDGLRRLQQQQFQQQLRSNHNRFHRSDIARVYADRLVDPWPRNSLAGYIPGLARRVHEGHGSRDVRYATDHTRPGPSPYVCEHEGSGGESDQNVTPSETDESRSDVAVTAIGSRTATWEQNEDDGPQLPSAQVGSAAQLLSPERVSKRENTGSIFAASAASSAEEAAPAGEQDSDSSQSQSDGLPDISRILPEHWGSKTRRVADVIDEDID